MEGLLDDDEDMESMYLSRKERQREAKEAATAAEEEEAAEAEDEFSDGETIPEEDEEEDEEDDTDDKMSSTLPSRFEQRKSMTQPIETPFSQNGVQKTGLASMISLSLNLCSSLSSLYPLCVICRLNKPLWNLSAILSVYLPQ